MTPYKPSKRQISLLLQPYSIIRGQISKIIQAVLGSNERDFRTHRQRLLDVIKSAERGLDPWARKNICAVFEAQSAEAAREIESLGLALPNKPSQEEMREEASQIISSLLVHKKSGFLVLLQTSLRNIWLEANGLESKIRAVDEAVRACGEGEFIAGSFKDLFRGIRSLFGHTQIEHYVEVVARTKMREAALLGRRLGILSTGRKLVQISNTTDPTDSACSLYAGRAFALTEQHAREIGVPCVRSLPGGGAPFHVHCEHHEIVFYPEVLVPPMKEAAGSAPPSWALGAPWEKVQAIYERAKEDGCDMNELNPNLRYSKKKGWTTKTAKEFVRRVRKQVSKRIGKQ